LLFARLERVPAPKPEGEEQLGQKALFAWATDRCKSVPPTRIE
jgi:hypothetical protein